MNEFTKAFSDVVIGTTMSTGTFFGLFFLAFLAAFIRLLIRANKKRKTVGNETPYHFDFKFFIQDNILKFILNILVIAVAIRFSVEIKGTEATAWVSFLIGLSINEIILYIENKQNKARD